MKACANCGTYVEDIVESCPECGGRFVMVAKQDKAPVTSKKKDK
jgi:RNA polymerase subunit RPABC4/transcription elongation factor Spt4